MGAGIGWSVVMSEFFAMGGYAFYVWSSFGLTFIVMALNLLIPYFQRSNTLKTIAARAKRQQRRKR